MCNVSFISSKTNVLFVLSKHQADLQDVPFVLELAGHHSCSSPMQVRPQTGFPIWPVPALGASHPAIRQALLPLSCTSHCHKHAQVTANPAMKRDSTERRQ